MPDILYVTENQRLAKDADNILLRHFTTFWSADDDAVILHCQRVEKGKKVKRYKNYGKEKRIDAESAFQLQGDDSLEMGGETW